MTEHNPNHNSSIEELCLSMYTGKGSEGIDNIDTYLVAERTLHGMINEAMLGKGESAEEMIGYIGLILKYCCPPHLFLQRRNYAGL